jgi:glyoxylase-like metal-dependent hydrolase (beta-lactamase superfamily II)
MHARTTAVVLAAIVAAAASIGARAPRLPSPRLYVLDCGTLVGRNLRSYGLPPEPRDLSVACAVVVDGSRTLLWETGLGDRLTASGHPSNAGWQVTRTLRSQLAEVGVDPAAITFLAISHSHGDHMGNANDYAGATWLVQEAERGFAFAQRDLSAYSALRDSRTILLHGDRDVFGDGVATLLSTPGHTPGHQSLMVTLPHAGAILLTGDLYHYPEERAAKTFPNGELDRAKTAASRERVEALAQQLHAQVWIEHDLLGYAKLRKAPEFYH